MVVSYDDIVEVLFGQSYLCRAEETSVMEGATNDDILNSSENNLHILSISCACEMVVALLAILIFWELTQELLNHVVRSFLVTYGCALRTPNSERNNLDLFCEEIFLVEEDNETSVSEPLGCVDLFKQF